MQFPVSGVNCFKCNKPIFIAMVEAHPTRPGLVYHNYECVNCGRIMAKVVSIYAHVIQADQESHRDSP